MMKEGVLKLHGATGNLQLAIGKKKYFNVKGNWNIVEISKHQVQIVCCILSIAC